MSRELEVSGYWEGDAVYSCDNCGAQQSFPFDSEDVGSKEHRKELREKQLFNLKDFSENFAELCLLVDEVERKRGHNKQANFEKNGKECEEFHTTALHVCDILYQYI